MKNSLIVGVIGAMLAIVSCSTVKNGQTAQSNRSEFLKLKGNWEISSIDYDKNYRVKPFDEGVDSKCWIGSQWKLIPNNYTGTYILNGGEDCPSATQPIKFEVVNGTEFKFKKIVEGTKAKQNLSGYSLNIVNQTDTTFTLEQNVTSGSDNVKILYNFQKINN